MGSTLVAEAKRARASGMDKNGHLAIIREIELILFTRFSCVQIHIRKRFMVDKDGGGEIKPHRINSK